MKKISQNQKDRDGAYVIQSIESLLEEIMVHFVKGYSDFTLHSQRSIAVLNKISAIVKNLLNTTCLNAQEIDDLILVVAY